MQWFIDHWQMLLGGFLWIVNEVLAANPNWKSNSIVQLVLNVLKSMLPSSSPPPQLK